MEPGEFKCRWKKKDEIFRIADNIRNRFWPENTLPVDIEQIIEFRLKLDIDPKHGLLSLMEMDAYLKADLSGIVVDYDCYMSEKFENRRRFSFGHELGHYFLHEYIYDELSFETADEWKNFVLKIPEKEYAGFEWQANEFAGRLLVPYDALLKETTDAIKIVNKLNLSEQLREDSDMVLSVISPKIRKRFGVSTDVIERRIRREGLWPPPVK